mmetsp:Transcript_142979/g.249513  ORF Transcript_142979/g.249513 Transcript_142979/m.249513 type:complete len:226 (-) Transcript_142979:542-1219(-)
MEVVPDPRIGAVAGHHPVTLDGHHREPVLVELNLLLLILWVIVPIIIRILICARGKRQLCIALAPNSRHLEGLGVARVTCNWAPVACLPVDCLPVVPSIIPNRRSLLPPTPVRLRGIVAGLVSVAVEPGIIYGGPAPLTGIHIPPDSVVVRVQAVGGGLVRVASPWAPLAAALRSARSGTAPALCICPWIRPRIIFPFSLHPSIRHLHFSNLTIILVHIAEISSP